MALNRPGRARTVARSEPRVAAMASAADCGTAGSTLLRLCEHSRTHLGGALFGRGAFFSTSHSLISIAIFSTSHSLMYFWRSDEL